MKQKGARTRAAILDIAERLVLAHGIAGTSLSEIAAEAMLTKGAVFYHFADKDALARALIERSGSENLRLLEAFAEAASRRSEDPLDRLMLVLKMLEDKLAAAEHSWGSVRAALSYQSMEFSEETEQIIARSFKRQAKIYAAFFDEILETYRPVKNGTAMVLAETLLAVIEGAVLLARAQNDPKRAAMPIAQFRTQLAVLFTLEPVLCPSTAPAE